MRLKLIFAVLVGLLLLVAPGCGSKKKSAATTNTTTTQQATTSTTSTTTAGGLNLTNKDCANLLAAQSTIQKATTAGKLPSDIAAQIAALQTLAKTAPAAISGDFQVLADSASKLSKLNVPPGQQLSAAQLQQLLATLDIAKLSTASQHIAAWAKANCTKP